MSDWGLSRQMKGFFSTFQLQGFWTAAQGLGNKEFVPIKSL